MIGVVITLLGILAMVFMFYSMIRAGSKSDEQLHELTKKALG